MKRLSFLKTEWFKLVLTILMVHEQFLNHSFEWTCKTDRFLLNKVSLPNEQFFSFFTERSFSEKTNEINGKYTIVLRTNEIIFFERLWKNERNGSSMNERNEKNAPISKPSGQLLDVRCLKNTSSGLTTDKVDLTL